MRVSFAAFVGLLFSLHLVRPALAQTTPQFQVPEGCGSAETFQVELVRIAGPSAKLAAPVLLEITQNSPAQTFKLHLEHAGQIRELSDASCAILFRSAVVIVATQLKSEALQESLPPKVEAPAVEVRRSPAPKAPSVRARPAKSARESRAISEPSTPAPKSETRGAVRPTLSLALGAVAGNMPRTSPALELQGGFETLRFGAQLAGIWLTGARAQRDGRGVHLYELGVRALATLRVNDNLRLGLGATFGRYTGTGRGVATSATESATDIAPSAEVAVKLVEQSVLRLDVVGQGYLSLIRPRFEVTGYNAVVYRVPLLGAGVLLRGTWIR